MNARSLAGNQDSGARVDAFSPRDGVRRIVIKVSRRQSSARVDAFSSATAFGVSVQWLDGDRLLHDDAGVATKSKLRTRTGGLYFFRSCTCFMAIQYCDACTTHEARPHMSHPHLSLQPDTTPHVGRIAPRAPKNQHDATTYDMASWNGASVLPRK